MSPAANAVEELLFNWRDGTKPCLRHFLRALGVDSLLDEFRRPHLDVERDFITNLHALIAAEDAPKSIPARLVHAGCSDALSTFAIATANRDHVADSARSWARPDGVSL